jgi:hypothetical protein
MQASAVADPFNDLKQFLIKAGTLEETDANIYVLGLKKGIITSGDVVDAQILPRQTTAADHLRKLFNSGYFEGILAEENRKGKGRARKFKAALPEAVLKDLLEMYQGLNTILGKIREHREILAEAGETDDEVWLIRPQKMVIQKTALMIQGAKQSVKLYGHDCTWFKDTSINTALGKASKNQVHIIAVATAPDEKIIKGFKRIGVEIKQTSSVSIPFCLIDDSILLLPCRGGVLENEYFAIATRQKYLIGNFIQMFNGIKENKN